MPRSDEVVAEGKRIRAMREGLGLSRDRFAARIGISPVTLKNVENGIQKLGRRSLEQAEMIASQLSTTGSVEDGVTNSVGQPCGRTDSPDQHTPASPGIPSDAVIAKVIGLAGRKETLTAAQALSELLGVSVDDALVIAVRERMAHE